SYLLGTTSTGDTARLSTVWLTEPNNSPVNPPRPRVPTTTNDAVREASDNTSAGSTSKNRHCTGTLVCCVTSSATCARRDATSLRMSGIAVPYIGEIGIHMLLLSGSAVTSVNERLRSRSEEHTSELQSRFDLVCRLLLEKKHAQALGDGAQLGELHTQSRKSP